VKGPFATFIVRADYPFHTALFSDSLNIVIIVFIAFVAPFILSRFDFETSIYLYKNIISAYKNKQNKSNKKLEGGIRSLLRRISKKRYKKNIAFSTSVNSCTSIF